MLVVGYEGLSVYYRRINPRITGCNFGDSGVLKHLGRLLGCVCLLFGEESIKPEGYFLCLAVRGIDFFWLRPSRQWNYFDDIGDVSKLKNDL